jgi:predicted transcriptional regulator
MFVRNSPRHFYSVVCDGRVSPTILSAEMDKKPSAPYMEKRVPVFSAINSKSSVKPVCRRLDSSTKKVTPSENSLLTESKHYLVKKLRDAERENSQNKMRITQLEHEKQEMMNRIKELEDQVND